MNSVGAIGSSVSVKDVMALRQQIFDRSQLLRELQQPSNAASTSATGATGSVGGFGDTLKQALAGVNESQTRAASLSEGYERGEVTDIAKVMLARQEAGVAFEATLQVRNKLISAYQETMRMGI